MPPAPHMDPPLVYRPTGGTCTGGTMVIMRVLFMTNMDVAKTPNIALSVEM